MFKLKDNNIVYQKDLIVPFKPSFDFLHTHINSFNHLEQESLKS